MAGRDVQGLGHEVFAGRGVSQGAFQVAMSAGHGDIGSALQGCLGIAFKVFQAALGVAGMATPSADKAAGRTLGGIGLQRDLPGTT